MCRKLKTGAGFCSQKKGRAGHAAGNPLSALPVGLFPGLPRGFLHPFGSAGEGARCPRGCIPARTAPPPRLLPSRAPPGSAGQQDGRLGAQRLGASHHGHPNASGTGVRRSKQALLHQLLFPKVILRSTCKSPTPQPNGLQPPAPGCLFPVPHTRSHFPKFAPSGLGEKLSGARRAPCVLGGGVRQGHMGA